MGQSFQFPRHSSLCRALVVKLLMHISLQLAAWVFFHGSVLCQIPQKSNQWQTSVALKLLLRPSSHHKCLLAVPQAWSPTNTPVLAKILMKVQLKQQTCIFTETSFSLYCCMPRGKLYWLISPTVLKLRSFLLWSILILRSPPLPTWHLLSNFWVMEYADSSNDFHVIDRRNAFLMLTSLF